MALFQKKPQTTSAAPLYSVGAHKTVLIIGLGNPGKGYDGTRHNIGFAVLDEFASRNEFPAWIDKKDLRSLLSIHQLGENRVILAKPTTFMNDSGSAAQALQHFYKVPNAQTLAVYDELAIPFGQIRTRVGGSDAGHNGVKSLIQNLGYDFGRLRIGIGNERVGTNNTADFVLSKFGKKERDTLGQVLGEASTVVTEYIFGGELPHDTRRAF